MPEEKYTRCPGCATVFRVTPEQLAVRGGQVRCGQCKAVFDALAQQVALTSPFRADARVPRDEGAAGAPAATSPEGQAPESPSAAPSAAQDAAPSAAQDAAPSAAPDAVPDAVPGAAMAVPVGEPSADVAPIDRFAPAESATAKRTRLALYATAIALLVLLVAAQAAFHFRDAIVTFRPEARPAFARLCAAVGWWDPLESTCRHASLSIL